MNRNEFKSLIEQKIVVLDGATGTELVKRGMPHGACPEIWALENPAATADIQEQYIAAGSDIIYVPSFGANRFKLEMFGAAERTTEINRELAALTKQTLCGRALAFGDLAPTGRFIKPLGEVPLETMIDVYKECVSALLEGGVDGFVIETMMDIREARAATLAVREICDLPIMATMTFDENHTTLTGTDPLSALITLQALGVDAFGCNCSTGPRSMAEVMKMLKPYATIPLIAKPNAGMPKLVDGETVFDMGAAEFAGLVPELTGNGANIIGGCCGSSPEYIKAVAKVAAKQTPLPPAIDAIGAVSSPRKTCFISPDKPFVVIGERINPTGKKEFQAELRKGKMTTVGRFAREQAEAGAAILDVNMGLSGIDEKAMMVEAISQLCRTVDLPLCIDSTDSEVVEAALRAYPGRALVNSISAERERLEKTLPAAAKYGAMFILLPLTDDGIPATAAERAEVVKKVYSEAEKYGYSKQDITVDALVMTVSSNQSAAMVALDLIEWAARDFGINTVCGLSNVSFGMPERQWINAAFLGMALGRGVNMAIFNPSTTTLTALTVGSDVISGRDEKMRNYVKKFAQRTDAGNAAKNTIEMAPLKMVGKCVLNGDDETIADAINAALATGVKPEELVDDCLIPAINKVGELYDRKEYFLPQLIMSADAMRKGFETLEPLLAEKRSGEQPGAVIVLATVEGDIHDIGKNIVALMLRNYGFEVVDLGKDVKAANIIAAAKQHNAALVGLSALMTTTMVKMAEVIELANSEGLDHLKFMIGGAVVDREFAAQIGAEAYCADALEAVRTAQKLLS